MKSFFLCVVFGAFLGLGSAQAIEDPFLWLEDAKSEKAEAWVKGQNERTASILKKDPRFAIMRDEVATILKAKDRIPLGSIRGEYFYNLWKDDKNQRGLWRRATLAGYLTEKPDWETLIDIDALSKAENEQWVFSSANCLEPQYTRCLVKLSRGGGDKIVVREFDVTAKTFVKDGFTVPEAKTRISWADADTVLIASDFGKGSLTTSGYPRIVKKWKRATPLAQAITVMEGKETDVSVR